MIGVYIVRSSWHCDRNNAGERECTEFTHYDHSAIEIVTMQYEENAQSLLS
jgi:hypothetical protein